MNLKIRKATINDAQYLFSLANDKLARKNSFNSNPINFDEHLEWLKSKIISTDSYIYICSVNGVRVGMVKFDILNETIIGINIDPLFRGRGLASKLILEACNEFWHNHDNDIFAYIKKSNLISVKSFEKAMFKKHTHGVINEIECEILIARKNENR